MTDENRIMYKRKLYEALIAMASESGRLQKVDKSSLMDLSANTQAQLEKIVKKQVGEEVPFWSHERFEERDINNILQFSHKDITAYWTIHGRENMGLRRLSHTLNIRFYNLSD